MSLTNILGIPNPKVRVIKLREGRRLHTFHGRHEWRRDENAAWHKNHVHGKGTSSPRLPLSLEPGEIKPETFIGEYDGAKDYRDPILGLLHSRVPGLLDDYSLSTVIPLINRYGIQAVIEGYQASQATGFPFVAEVIASSNDTSDTSLNLVDPYVLEILVEEQGRGVHPADQLHGQAVVYRRDPTPKSNHFYEHMAEQALEQRV